MFYYKDPDPVIGDQIFKDPSRIYSLSLRWDCIINTHGNVGTYHDGAWTPEEFAQENEEINDAIEKSTEINDIYRHISELEIKLKKRRRRRAPGLQPSNENERKDDGTESNNRKKIRDEISESYKKIERIKQEITIRIQEKHPNLHDKNDCKEKFWYCLPVKINDHPEQTDLYDAIRDAIDDGYRRILILACNGGHLDLPSDIKARKNVIIRMSKNVTVASTRNPKSTDEYHVSRTASVVTARDFGIK